MCQSMTREERANAYARMGRILSDLATNAEREMNEIISRMDSVLMGNHSPEWNPVASLFVCVDCGIGKFTRNDFAEFDCDPSWIPATL